MHSIPTVINIYIYSMSYCLIYTLNKLLFKNVSTTYKFLLYQINSDVKKLSLCLDIYKIKKFVIVKHIAVILFLKS